MPKPDPIWLYRMTHVGNLRHILQYGIVAEEHPSADPNYVSIGHNSLIAVRRDLNAPNPPGGTFSHYVPFYLGHRSPMLYQIATGYEGVAKIPQSDIVYLVTNHDSILQHGLGWFFTDGHARHGMTKFYTSEAGFDELDWEAVYAVNWKNTDIDPDRQRKKQAEYMVKTAVPLSCIKFILVFETQCQQKIENLQIELNRDIPVRVSKQAYYDRL